ncbi:MAG: histone deacetylase [Methanoregula sp.]|nr:histone deacetylase [Methanoregula sp.]
MHCSAIIDPRSAWHDAPGHPECHARLEDVLSVLPPDLSLYSATPATRKDVERIHDPNYIRWLEQKCEDTPSVSYLDRDTYITQRSCDVALLAAGAAIAATERAMDGEHCFSLMRPPGHHAERDRAMGFCLLNNAAIAAMHALESVDRVAIIDWDVHHGNGTQHAFYRSDRVLYCSVHQKGLFPYSGYSCETGAGAGLGYTINVPLAAGAGIGDYQLVFSEIFCPALRSFRPDLVIISAGQDILFDDPLGWMQVKPEDFAILTRLIQDAADGSLALVLEGGYSPSHGEAVRQIISTLRDKCDIKSPETLPHLRKRWQPLRNLKKEMQYSDRSG